MVRHGSAKPLSPSSNLGGASKKEIPTLVVGISFLCAIRFEIGCAHAHQFTFPPQSAPSSLECGKAKESSPTDEYLGGAEPSRLGFVFCHAIRFEIGCAHAHRFTVPPQSAPSSLECGKAKESSPTGEYLGGPSPRGSELFFVALSDLKSVRALFIDKPINICYHLINLF